MSSKSMDPMPRLNIWRVLPLLLLGALLIYGFSEGWHEAYTPRNISDRIDYLRMMTEEHFLWILCVYILTYVIIVSLSLPGASLLTLLGGFMFGWMIAGPVIVISATIGATVVFFVAKTAIGDLIRARAGPALDRLAKGFSRDAFNYLLFLRLVPLFPFWLVNIAPAFLGVRIGTYIIATLIGIAPATFAYSYAGGSLDSVFESARMDEGFQACMGEETAGVRAEGSCPLHVDFGDLVTTEIILAFVFLGLLSLVPVVLRRLRRDRDEESESA